HIHSEGKGGPPVILDAGGGCSSLDWALVQPELAKLTKVCSYDRAGYGWSEESSKSATSQNAVEDLHTLLQKAKIPTPYILVGHSFGGLNMRLYASYYPDEVAGMVLVESSHEELLDRTPLAPQLNWVQRIFTNQKVWIWACRLGLVRLTMPMQLHKVIQGWSCEAKNVYCAKNSTVKAVKAKFAEASMDVQKQSMEQLKDAKGLLGDKPLIVMTAKSLLTTAEMSSFPQELKEYMTAVTKAHEGWQKDLVSKSTQGKQIIIENSSHMIPYDQPGVIVDVVQELVEQLRR
ncbi:MAG: alpha/beta hydrolase, partial [Chlamydiota bacterium]